MTKLTTPARTAALSVAFALAFGSSAFAQGSGTANAPTLITGNTSISASHNTQTAVAIGNLNKVTNTNASIHQGTTIKGNTTIVADHNTQTAVAIGNLNEVRNANASIGAP